MLRSISVVQDSPTVRTTGLHLKEDVVITFELLEGYSFNADGRSVLPVPYVPCCITVRDVMEGGNALVPISLSPRVLTDIIPDDHVVTVKELATQGIWEPAILIERAIAQSLSKICLVSMKIDGEEVVFQVSFENSDFTTEGRYPSANLTEYIEIPSE